MIEGFKQSRSQGSKEKAKELQRSVCELETQILLSGDFGSLMEKSLSKLQDDIGEVEKMLKALTKSLENYP